MRVYYLELYGKPLFAPGVTNVNKIPDLIKGLNIGARVVKDIIVDTTPDKYQFGYGPVEFKLGKEIYNWNISSLKIKQS